MKPSARSDGRQTLHTHSQPAGDASWSSPNSRCSSTTVHWDSNVPRTSKVGQLRQTCPSRKSPKSQETRDYPSQIRILFDRRSRR